MANALTKEQRALFGGYSTETTDIRDAIQKTIRDLKVIIITRDIEIDVTPAVMSFIIFEDLDIPYLTGQLKILDNSALTSAMPLVGQETIEISFTRAGKSVNKEFSCTNISDVTKALNEAAGVTLNLLSKKCLTDSVSNFSNDVPFAVYPNPSDNILNTNVTGTKRIFSLLGREVLQSNKLSIDISSLSSGVYIISHENQRIKFIKK